MNLKLTVLVIGLLTATSTMIGCSTVEKYPELSKLSESVEAGNLENGLYLTKRGAVLDITVEEVQAQKKRLEEKLYESEESEKFYKAEYEIIKQQMRELRLASGLSPERANRKILSYNGGIDIEYEEKQPTFDEELIQIKNKFPSKVKETEVIVQDYIKIEEK